MINLGDRGKLLVGQSYVSRRPVRLQTANQAARGAGVADQSAGKSCTRRVNCRAPLLEIVLVARSQARLICLRRCNPLVCALPGRRRVALTSLETIRWQSGKEVTGQEALAAAAARSRH